MRLIRVGRADLALEEFNDGNVPPYAILSHVWGNDEILYDDLPLISTQFVSKLGISKVWKACEQARRHGLEYVWIDTCCINKSSTTELSEAINSMFRWYERAHVCFTYLEDHEPSSGRSLEQSKWFTRGWTLQELIAPKKVVFFDQNWTPIGTKEGLATRLSAITNVQKEVLTHQERPSRFSIAQRMSWAAGRQTTRIEDRAYSLLGLFDVTIPLIYGVSSSRSAFILLQEEIIKHSDDQTIFAWDLDANATRDSHYGLLAESPDAFLNCSQVVCTQTSDLNLSGFGKTNVGLTIALHTKPYCIDTYLGILDCTEASSTSRQTSRYGIILERLENRRQFARVGVKGVGKLLVCDPEKRVTSRSVCVQQQPGQARRHCFYGFWVQDIHLPGNTKRHWRGQIRISGAVRAPAPPRQGFLVEFSPSVAKQECVIEFRERNRRWRRTGHVIQHQIRKVTLRFDEEFVPECLISMGTTRDRGVLTGATTGKSYGTMNEDPELGELEHYCSLKWEERDPNPKKYVCRSYIDPRRLEEYSTVTMELQRCPSDLLEDNDDVSNNEQCGREQGQLIWCVSIHEKEQLYLSINGTLGIFYWFCGMLGFMGLLIGFYKITKPKPSCARGHLHLC